MRRFILLFLLVVLCFGQAWKTEWKNQKIKILATEVIDSTGWTIAAPWTFLDTVKVKDDDDSLLVKAIDETHTRGMDFWLYYTGHHYGQLYRPVCAETFEGVPYSELPSIPYALCQSLITVCFNKPSVADWDLTAYTFGARNYDVDGIYVTHFRYANPSFFTNLFGKVISIPRTV